jgi:hypothetical protein
VATAFADEEHRWRIEANPFDDVATRQMLLDARAREILEDHLAVKFQSYAWYCMPEEQVRQIELIPPDEHRHEIALHLAAAEFAPTGMGRPGSD